MIRNMNCNGKLSISLTLSDHSFSFILFHSAFLHQLPRTAVRCVVCAILSAHANNAIVFNIVSFICSFLWCFSEFTHSHGRAASTHFNVYKKSHFNTAHLWDQCRAMRRHAHKHTHIPHSLTHSYIFMINARSY